MLVTDIKVPRTKYAPETLLAITYYPSSGGTALILVNPTTKEKELVASVNLEDYGVPTPPENLVWVKDYSENQGVADALQSAGVTKPYADAVFQTEFVDFHQHEIVGPALEWLAKAPKP